MQDFIIIVILIAVLGYALYDYFYVINKFKLKRKTKTPNIEFSGKLFLDEKQRIGIILEYQKCFGKLVCGMGNESDLPFPKKLIKIALIEELMFPREKGLDIQKEEFVKFLEDCLLMLDKFLPSEEYNRVKLYDQEMAGGYASWASRTEDMFKDMDTKEVCEYIEKSPLCSFAEVNKNLTPKYFQNLCLINLLKEFRENSKDDSVVKQLYEIINKIAKE